MAKIIKGMNAALGALGAYSAIQGLGDACAESDALDRVHEYFHNDKTYEWRLLAPLPEISLVLEHVKRWKRRKPLMFGPAMAIKNMQTVLKHALASEAKNQAMRDKKKRTRGEKRGRGRKQRKEHELDLQFLEGIKEASRRAKWHKEMEQGQRTFAAEYEVLMKARLDDSAQAAAAGRPPSPVWRIPRNAGGCAAVRPPSPVWLTPRNAGGCAAVHPPPEHCGGGFSKKRKKSRKRSRRLRKCSRRLARRRRRRSRRLARRRPGKRSRRRRARR